MSPPPRSARAPSAVLGVLLLLAGALWWWFCGNEAPPQSDAGARVGPEAAVPAAADLQGAPPDERIAAPAPAVAAAPGPTLRVRLRGLRPEAPWTAAVKLKAEGRDEPHDTWLSHDDARPLAADGLATFPLPAWCRDASRQKGRIEARDPNYLAIQHRYDGAFDLDHELVLDVQAVGVLQAAS